MVSAFVQEGPGVLMVNSQPQKRHNGYTRMIVGGISISTVFLGGSAFVLRDWYANTNMMATRVPVIELGITDLQKELEQVRAELVAEANRQREWREHLVQKLNHVEEAVHNGFKSDK